MTFSMERLVVSFLTCAKIIQEIKHLSTIKAHSSSFNFHFTFDFFSCANFDELSQYAQANPDQASN